MLGKASCLTEHNLVFCPERTIEGKALDELYKNPQIIATPSLRSLVKAKAVFDLLGVDLIPMNTFEQGEIGKLSDNTYRDITFAFSNLVSLLAAKYEFSAKELVEKLNFNYPRNSIARPSLGVGGPCLTKDPWIFNIGIDTDIQKTGYLLAGRQINELVIDRCVTVLRLQIETQIRNGTNPELVLCGLAFKGEPITNDIRDSTSLIVSKRLRSFYPNLSIYCVDSIISDETLDENAFERATIENISKVTLLLIGNNSKQNVRLLNNLLESSGRLTKTRDRLFVYDPWAMLLNNYSYRYLPCEYAVC